MFKLDLDKAEEPEIKAANIRWIIKKAREFQKNIYFCIIDYAKAFEELIFWTVVLEKTLESPLDCKEIQPVHPKEIRPEYSLEGLMLKLKL